MNAREFMGNSFRKNIFLVMMIGLGAYCGGTLLTSLLSVVAKTSDVFDLIVSLAMLIAPVITLVAGINLYRGVADNVKVSRLSAYCTFMKVIYIILAVAVAILGVVLVAAFALLGNMLIPGTESYDMMIEAINQVDPTYTEVFIEFFSVGTILLVSLSAIVVILVLAVLILHANTFSALAKRFKELAAAYEANDYLFENKVPKVRLWICGILGIALAVGSLATSPLDAIATVGSAVFLICAALWLEETTKEHIRLRTEEWNKHDETVVEPAEAPSYVPSYEPEAKPSYESTEEYGAEPPKAPVVDLKKSPDEPTYGATDDNPNDKNVSNKIDKHSL